VVMVAQHNVIPLNCTLQNDQDGKFCVTCICHNKKKVDGKKNTWEDRESWLSAYISLGK
jgi:hypothetical protein